MFCVGLGYPWIASWVWRLLLEEKRAAELPSTQSEVHIRRAYPNHSVSRSMCLQRAATLIASSGSVVLALCRVSTYIYLIVRYVLRAAPVSFVA